MKEKMIHSPLMQQTQSPKRKTQFQKTCEAMERAGAVRKQREKRTQWKVKLFSGSAGYRDGLHDVQLKLDVASVGHGNQLEVIRLITAAPELLEALANLVEQIVSDGAINIVRARAAIAKTEGRESLATQHESEEQAIERQLVGNGNIAED